MKQLREMIDRDVRDGARRDMEVRQNEAVEAGLGLGKKEAARRRAEIADKSDDWSELLGRRIN